MAKGKNAKDKSNYSSYWFDDKDYTVASYGFDADDGEDMTKEDEERQRKAERMVELLKLSAFMRSAKNFVGILTGRQDIHVKYEDGDNSYTDGKTVTISSKVEGNFDSTIGLALHEASHCAITDFGFIKRMFEDVKFRRQYVTDDMIKRVIKLNPKIENWNWSKLFDRHAYPQFDEKSSPAHRSADVFLTIQFKDIVNWVEDRRIDTWVYNTAPGYRGYYEALYNRYFYAEEINKSLKENKMHTEETMDSYMARIINLMNPNNNLDSLKGLKQIKNIIDTKNIKRLGEDATGTSNVADVSKQVLEVIMQNIKGLDFMTMKMPKLSVDVDGDGNAGDGMEIDLDKMTDEQCKKMFGMGKKALEKYIKKLAEQRNFVAGNVDKKKLSKSDAKQMNTLQVGGVTMELAGGEEFSGQTVKVILVEKLSEEVINGDAFDGSYGVFTPMEHPDREMQEAVTKGFTMGKMLGRKLQVRNEEKTLKHTRQDAGKIDRRLVHNLGYDIENVFSKVETSRYNKAHLHISVDASGSMGGRKFWNATQMAVAMAVACKMNTNLECVITYRSVANSYPLVYVAYDSRKNGLSHIKKYFPHFMASSSTPESLCFEAMMRKVFPTVQSGEQFYFVNLSDGEPAFSGGVGRDQFRYYGYPAVTHCKRIINRMQSEKGATILSYFIGHWSYGGVSESFNAMYGATNTFMVDANSVIGIANTMNRKFMSKTAMTQVESSI